MKRKSLVKDVFKGSVSNRERYDGWMIEAETGRKHTLLASTFTRTRAKCRERLYTLKEPKAEQVDLFSDAQSTGRVRYRAVKVRLEFVRVT